MIDEDWVAGVGATLWRHEHDGPPTLLAHASVALPGVDNAQVVEAVGCRSALSLLTGLAPTQRVVRIVGDNLAVIRYGVGTARLRRLHLQAHLEQGLGNALTNGWQLTWQAVRRRLNTAAYFWATQGVFLAARLRSQGVTTQKVSTHWYPEHA